MNKVILKGRLAREIELKWTTSGKAVATSCIAVNRRGKDAGADFINIVVWGTIAEVMAKYLIKGNEVLVEGRLQVRNYDDRDGNKRYVTEVVVENFEFCGSKNGSAGNAGDSAVPSFEGGTSGYNEDIPF